MADGTVSNLSLDDIDARGIDFKAKVGKKPLFVGETIASATFVVMDDNEADLANNAPSAGVVILPNSTVVTGTLCSVMLQAMALGDYVLECQIETSTGRELVRSATFSVEYR